eukprot:g2546.t1
MCCCCRLSTFCAIAAVFAAAVLGWLNAGGMTDGTIPAFHLLEAHEFSEEKIGDLRGRRAVVTGASSGLGLGVARALAKAGATVIVTARTEEKCTATLENLKAHAGDQSAARFTCEILELLDMKHVAETAQTLSKLTIDYLVLNAGIMAPKTLLVSKDGFEEQWQVNHLAQFQLLRILIPALKKAPNARVVFVSSLAHHFSPDGWSMLSLEAMLDESNYQGDRWYGWSKLCNILMARELARREPTIASHAVHPGGVQGRLLRYSGLSWPTIHKLEGLLYWDVDTAALSVMRPLVDPSFSADPGNKNGRYIVPVARERQTSKQGDDEKLGKALWNFSAKSLHT